ncbi:MAG: C45 family peptidase [Burkholderiaceae bacterium]
MASSFEPDDAARRLAAQATRPPRIVLRGSARARGREYGTHMAERIERSLQAYRLLFETCRIDWQQAVALARPLEVHVARHFPHLLEELHGIAEGCGADYGSLLALNSRTEILPPNYLALATEGLVSESADECTAFATARAGEAVLLAQNWDWVGMQRDALVLIESHPDDGPAHLTVAEAGMLAKIGFNEHGFGVTLNILRSTRDGSQDGVPIHMLLRGLLDCRDLAQARERVAAMQFAGSSNVLMADAGGSIASLEASPAGARFVEADQGRLCHTNHFLDPELAEHEANLASSLSTEVRLRTARACIDAVHDVPTAVSLLSDTSCGLESICRFPDASLPLHARIETVLGVIMDLSDRTMHLSGAQPSESAFEAVLLSDAPDGLQ